MSSNETIVLFLVFYAVIAWGMFQAGKWKGDRGAWREADADSIRLACVEFDLEEMTTQRDMLAGYVDALEHRPTADKEHTDG